MPKVSIVMACYNHSKYVSEAIQSVSKQTFTDWELVIVDDASTDQSIEVINKAISKFKHKCSIFKHERNSGYGKTLRDAIDFSRGELIAIVDSDDVISKDTLSLVVPVHNKHPEASLVYTNYMKCDSSLKKVNAARSFQIPKGKTYLDFMTGVSHLKCFKKSFYDKTVGVDSTLLHTVDKDLILKLEEVGKLIYVETIGYFWRRHDDSISHSKDPKKESQTKDRIIESAKLRRSKQ